MSENIKEVVMEGGWGQDNGLGGRVDREADANSQRGVNRYVSGGSDLEVRNEGEKVGRGKNVVSSGRVPSL